VNEDTIVAISTPRGIGGIGVVRISGPSALFITQKIFSKEIKEPNYAYVGFVFDPKTQKRIDTAVATYFKAPHSYTGEDICELSMHGGIVNLEAILKITIQFGERIAQRGEFTKRALLNGKMDLIEANSVIELIEAKTDKALKVASSKLFGELSESVNEFRKNVVELISIIEAPIDFPFDADATPEEVVLVNLEHLKSKALQFLSTYKAGKAFESGANVVIIGKPNVGKSTLLNSLLKFDRAIVSEIPGTTRDTIEEVIDFYGVPIRLIDTAGYRSSAGSIESLGIERTRKAIQEADLVLFVFDAGDEISQEDTILIHLTEGKDRIIVLNKGDVTKVTTSEILEHFFKGEEIVEISALYKKGIDELEKIIYKKIVPNEFDTPLITSEREKSIFEEIVSHIGEAIKIKKDSHNDELVAEELKSALENISDLFGSSVSDEVLNTIFSKFCIGK
jgi:tRNA modification GTPase